MYMQNVLSVIEHKILNEVRYSLSFKSIAQKQIAKLDIVQATVLEGLKPVFSKPGQEKTTSDPKTDLASELTPATKNMIFDSLSRQKVP